MTSRMASQSSRSLDDYSHEFTADIGPRDGFQTASNPASDDEIQSVPTGARLDGIRDGSLIFASDASLPIPSTVDASVDAFMDLMRDASARGFIEDSMMRISDLARFYSDLASTYIWPPVAANRLSTLLEAKGFRRSPIRERRNGKDKKTVAFIITAKRRTS